MWEVEPERTGKIGMRWREGESNKIRRSEIEMAEEEAVEEIWEVAPAPSAWLSEKIRLKQLVVCEITPNKPTNSICFPFTEMAWKNSRRFIMEYDRAPCKQHWCLALNAENKIK